MESKHTHRSPLHRAVGHGQRGGGWGECNVIRDGNCDGSLGHGARSCDPLRETQIIVRARSTRSTKHKKIGSQEVKDTTNEGMY